MFNIRRFATGAAAALVLGSAACASNSQVASSAGDVLPSYDTYANSALLHIRSNYLGSVQVYTQAQGDRDYLGVASSISPTNIVLDPAIVPNANLYVVLVSADNQQKVLGPLQVKKGSVVDIRIPSTLRGTMAVTH